MGRDHGTGSPHSEEDHLRAGDDSGSVLEPLPLTQSWGWKIHRASAVSITAAKA